MTGPRLDPVVLSETERRVLQGWANRRRTVQGLAKRVRIVMERAEGQSNAAVARKLGSPGPG
jgi:hypothetical protein